MRDSVLGPGEAVFRAPPRTWAMAAAIVALLAIAFNAAIMWTAKAWTIQPEYSHGFIVPLICLFLVWQRRPEFESLEFTGSWSGLLIAALGLTLHVAGRLSALYVLQQYALLIVIYGVLLCALGWPAFRRLAIPLSLLVLAVPLPHFLLERLSAHLQLISSALGVAFIRLFGVSVFLEGNVIDLGTYKLQVAEACDGLRYLFPLMTLGLIMAYFYRAPFWKRALVFLSSIPITIVMNSFRIGIIGVMVEHWGVRMAEGFLHEFQGWVIFMASAALMIGEIAILSRAGAGQRSWRETFAIEFPPPTPNDVPRRERPLPAPLLAVTAVLALYTALVALMPERPETHLARLSFPEFPMQVAGWRGQSSPMEPLYLDALKVSDYLIADYSRSDSRPPVNLYVAWYDSQRAGQSAHSPRTCIPGGGWVIADLQEVTVPSVSVAGQTLRVNRALISLGDKKQVVYYWFQQRGRVITNEYLVKWYLFWDALTRNRTDGALIRLVSPVPAGQSASAADLELVQFAERVVPQLKKFVPE